MTEAHVRQDPKDFNPLMSFMCIYIHARGNVTRRTKGCRAKHHVFTSPSNFLNVCLTTSFLAHAVHFPVPQFFPYRVHLYFRCNCISSAMFYSHEGK